MLPYVHKSADQDEANDVGMIPAGSASARPGRRRKGRAPAPPKGSIVRSNSVNQVSV